MSRRLDVLQAVCALVAGALPSSDVLGIDNDVTAPTRLGTGGRAVIRSGDPGEPEMTLGILSYSYSHRIPIELTAAATETLSREEALDAMAEAIGTAIDADRTLGGLADWLEIEAMTSDDLSVGDAQALKGGDLAIIADYTTSNPLN